MGCNCAGKSGMKYLIQYDDRRPDETVDDLGTAQARVREAQDRGVAAGFRARVA